MLNAPITFIQTATAYVNSGFFFEAMYDSHGMHNLYHDSI